MAKSTKVKESKKAVAAEPVKAVAAKAAASKKVSKEEPSKKSKKKEPESSDESSEEEEDSDSASESESESESEEETTKKPAKKEAKKPAAKEESESESESDDSESDEEETKKPAVNGKAKAEESNDSESDSDEESDDEKPAAKESKADDSDDSEEDSDDSSDDEEKKAEPSKKRKADEEIDTSAKKTKLDSNAAPTLFAGSLAWSVDDDTLYQAFESFDGLVGARVVTEKGTGRSRGFGYVDFKDAESAQVAYNAMQGQDVGGRNINLDFANARPEGSDPQGRAADRAKKHGDTLSAESDTLFVGNLPFDIDQDSVTQFFNEVGAVTSVRLPTDPESGNLKGFGYVSFGSVEEAKAVLDAKNGATIGHGRFARSVRLDFSTPRPQGGAGGGRGGFGGGRGGPRGGGGRGGRGGRGGFGGGRGGNFSAVNRTKPAGTKISFD